MKRTAKYKTISATFISLFIMGAAGLAFSQFYPTHLDRTKLPQGCMTCHAGGHGVKKTALLKGGDTEVCLRCHDLKARERNINITHKTDIREVLTKTSRHPIEETSGLHRKGENATGMNFTATRHAACGDCHDPHWSKPDKPLDRIDGVNAFGVRLIEATAEYEVCYKCHADSPNQPPKARNKRLEFSSNNPSFHPVEGRGKSTSVPSLIAPLNTSSTITCTDCHGNDDPLGPKGPHGSIYAPILVANYETRDGLQENSYQFGLCYKCHDRNSLLRNQGFPLHNLHIVKVKASCYACHTAHGSQVNTHLVRFNPDVVGLPPQQGQAAPFPQPGTKPGFTALPQLNQTPLGVGTIEPGRYVDLGNGHGQCFLSCHGKVHNPLSY